MFDFLMPSDQTIEDLKNKQILELANSYITKTIELIEPLMDIKSDLFLKAQFIQSEAQSLLDKAHTTSQDIQTLLNHIKDLNETIQTCKELASAVFFIMPLFEALTFFMF